MMQRRKEDPEDANPVWIVIRRWMQTIIMLGAIVPISVAAFTHFATAADVEKKFTTLRAEMRMESAILQKKMMEIELFKLRSSGKNDPVTQAQIDQFESELNNLNAKIRELDRINK